MKGKLQSCKHTKECECEAEMIPRPLGVVLNVFLQKKKKILKICLISNKIFKVVLIGNQGYKLGRQNVFSFCSHCGLDNIKLHLWFYVQEVPALITQGKQTNKKITISELGGGRPTGVLFCISP